MTHGFIAVTILLTFLAIYSAPVADAHAILESSSPADQSVLDKSPARVRVTFSEPVTLVVGALRVFDSEGNRVDEGLASHGSASDQVVVGLKPNLPAGSYAVAWRVISADTHPVHGGFVFSVRKSKSVGGLDSLIDQPSQPGLQVAGGVLRAIGYLGSFIVVGAAVFVSFIQRRSEHRRPLTRVLTGVGVITVLAELLQLPVSAALATGEGLGSLFSPGVLGEVLGQGTSLTIIGVALATVAGIVCIVRTGSDRRFFAIAAVVLVTAAFVASGHSRSTDPTWLTSAVDAIHVAAAALWVGGLAMLVWSLRTRNREQPPGDPELAAAEVVGFSRLAMFSIAAVGVAGGVLAYLEVRSWRGLFSTGYGLLVIAKIALLVVLAMLGAFNHFRLVPALRKRPDRPARWRYFRRTIRIEAVVFVAVLGVTAALVNAIPARTELATRALYSASAQTGNGGSVNLVIDPARVGPSALHMYLLDAHGRPDDDEQSVSVSLMQSKLDIGPIEHDLHRAGPGHYLINGTLFTVSGTWKVTMRIRVDEFTEKTAVLHVNVSS